MSTPAVVLVFHTAMVAVSISLGGTAKASVSGEADGKPIGTQVHGHIRGRVPIRFRPEKLDPDGRYELRTYVGSSISESKDQLVDVYWIQQEPGTAPGIHGLKSSGDSTPGPELLPCPLPDVINPGGLQRNWRSGRELMERGLAIEPEIPGDVIGITYRKIGSPLAGTSERRIDLDGEWRIVSDPHDSGKTSGWQMPSAYPQAESRRIQVPGNVNEAYPGFDGIVWYQRVFTNHLPESPDFQPILRFRACSYRCDVWLNGLFLGSHEGGESPFELIATEQLRPDQNTVIMRVFFPKGNLLNGGNLGPCAYPVLLGMGGLTQGVELVSKPLVRVVDVFVRPDWKTGAVRSEIAILNTTNTMATVKVSTDYREHGSAIERGSISAEVTVPPGESIHMLDMVIPNFRQWSLEDPFLYSATVQARWKETVDTYEVSRFGFRDFRINASGFFELNGKRLLLKCALGINLDPLCLEGTPRDLTWLGVDFEIMKAAGFNAYRSAAYAALPEQLDLADELGFLIYNEHQGSWLMKDPAKFEVDLPGMIRRDRNHPSLVMWGLLNEVGYLWEKKYTDAIYDTARQFLPKLRAIDDTRLVLLSSGRFDRDFTTGSASNPGSSQWNVYLGGEDPQTPVLTNTLYDGGPYQAGAGDVHIYEGFPIRWGFVESMANITKGVRPIFVSEGGQASAVNPFAFRRSRLRMGTPSRLAEVIEPKGSDLEAIWEKYRLSDTYPNIEAMVEASQQVAADQRAIFFNVIRRNPNLNGFNLTSLLDTPDGEGILDEFRHFKAGHRQAMNNGWAKLKWCLLAEPLNTYAGQRLRISVSLANEDGLPTGNYPARISLAGPGGTVWSKEVTIPVKGGDNPPLAYAIADEEVATAGLAGGQYTLSAALLQRPNAVAGSIQLSLTAAASNPSLTGLKVTTLGLAPAVRMLLEQSGAVLREYGQNPGSQPEVILVGADFKGDEAAWQALFDRVGGGAFAIFLSRETLANAAGANQWMPLEPKGTQAGGQGEPNIFHTDIVGRKHPIFDGLPVGVLTPDMYGELLRPKARFAGIATPDDVAAVWININCSPGFHPKENVEDGIMIGIYKWRRGRFLVNSFDLIGNIGRPAADRLILNMVRYGATCTENRGS